MEKNKVEIYYFTGTGNSLSIAGELGKRLAGDTLKLVSALRQERIESKGNTIGLVFPIYDFKPPKPVEEFIKRLDNIKELYIFAVCTYGITVGGSLKYLSRIIESCGGHLSGGFGIAMPHNGIGSGLQTEAQRKEMLEGSRSSLDEIVKYIENHSKGRIESGSMLSVIFKYRFIKMIPSALKLVWILALKGTKALDFTANKDCNGCRICESICPAKNIAVKNGRPVWSDHCASCFACLHWCPKKAVSLGGNNLDIGIYHHPDVNVSDML